MAAFSWIGVAQPGPGDIFRETVWEKPKDRPPETWIADLACANPMCRDLIRRFQLDAISGSVDLDLKDAVRAEVLVEHWGGHIGSSNRRIRINGKAPLPLPLIQGAPARPECYFTTQLAAPVPIPLDQLRHGKNEFTFAVGPQICYGFDWGWFWVYGVTFRVYYKPAKAHPSGRIISPVPGAAAKEPVTAAAVVTGGTQVRQVDFIGEYRDFNWEGDGNFRQWHYQYENGRMKRHVGTVTAAPYEAVWDTAWVPDQDQPVRLMARLTDETGTSFMTPPVSFRLARADRSVKMYPSTGVPENFGVRVGRTAKCEIPVDGDPAGAVSARLFLSNWSGYQAGGIALNGHRLVETIGARHHYSFDAIPVPPHLLRRGSNEFSIFQSSAEHALEINWPGPALMAEYAKPCKGIRWERLSTREGNLPSPDVGSQVSTLILDIDRDGMNDFVIAGWGKPSMVWFRRGAGGWTRYVIDSGVEYIEAGGDFADIDGDGDFDIVQGGDWRTARHVWWWENPYPVYSPAKPWTRRAIKDEDAGGTSHHDQIFGDFNGDGKLELVFWNQYSGKLFLARIPPDPRNAPAWPLAVIFSYPLPKGGKYEGLAKADIDLDGKVDIIGAGRWFQHRGGTEFLPQDIDPSYYSTRSAAGDLKKGGRPEVVIGPGDGVGPLNWYEWNGTGWTKRTLIARVDHGHTLDVADVDGDGNLDILCAEMKGWNNGKSVNPRSKAWIFYGDGKGGFRETLLSEDFDHHESKLGDLDGDGDIDVLGKPFEWRTPNVDIWLQNGTGPRKAADRSR